MLRKLITKPSVVITLLIVQIIPLLMFPPKSFSPTSQEWWLPVLLAVLVIIADVQIIVRRTTALWPWYLVSFSQGFNVISRLMMFMPHASESVGGVITVDYLYLGLSIVSVLISALYIFFSELPDVRMSLYTSKSTSASA